MDDNPDAPDHLTGLMLSRIGSDVLADPDLKARAMKKAGDLARAGKDGTGHEPFEWNTYETRLGIYTDAKDYDNYLKTVNEMIECFGSTEELEGFKRKAEKLIAERDGGMPPEDQPEAGSGEQEPETQPVMPEQTPIETVQEVQVQPNQTEAQPEDGNERIWLFALIAVLLIGVGAFFARRRGTHGQQ